MSEPRAVSSDQQFAAGVAWALATLNKMHDQPSMCADVLAASGFKVEDFRHIKGFEGAEIRRIYRKERHRIGNYKATL